MKSKSALLLLLLVFTMSPSQTFPCMWDRDTLAAEAKGLPGVVEIITGRFDRNPPQYYEMRLKRVSKELTKDPHNFNLLDDAAVASDRLGRPDEALAWMEKKRQALELSQVNDEVTSEARYRYLANTGTFYAHRWIGAGADYMNVEDLEKASEIIAAAIKQNPGAHFGREIYQLKLIDSLVSDSKAEAQSWPLLRGVQFDLLHGTEAAEAARGYSGLVVLGNAWESPVVYLSLSSALGNTRNASLAYLAYLRAHEIVYRNEKIKQKPDRSTGVFQLISHNLMPLESSDLDSLETEYWRLRNDADQWHISRTQFMLDKLRAGNHPDVDKDFWSGYKAKPPPELSERKPEREQKDGSIEVVMFGGFFMSIILLIVAYLAQQSIKARKHRAETSEHEMPPR